jgi:hypothetical protein
MKYLLIVFGDFKNKTKFLNSVAESITIISDTEETKFTYGDATLVMNFTSELEPEEVYLFIDELIKDITTLYFLTPYNGLVYTSLPIDIHSHLFGNPNFNFDDIYGDEIIDLEPQTSKNKRGVHQRMQPRLQEPETSRVSDQNLQPRQQDTKNHVAMRKIRQP